MKKAGIIKTIAVLAVLGVLGTGGYFYLQNLKGKAERARTAPATLREVPAAGTNAAAAAPSTDAVKPAVTAVPAGPVQTLKFAPDSLIRWTGYKKVGQHSGWFILFDGTCKIPGTNIEQAVFDLSIETESVETDEKTGLLTSVMKKESFFDCKKFPTSTFKSVSIVKAEGPDKYTMTGDLQLRDITKRLEFPAVITLDKGVIKLDADFKVNRRWWNIVWQSGGDSFLYDDARLEIKITAKE